MCTEPIPNIMAHMFAFIWKMTVTEYLREKVKFNAWVQKHLPFTSTCTSATNVHRVLPLMLDSGDIISTW